MYDLVPVAPDARLVRLIGVRGMSSRWPGSVAVVGSPSSLIAGSLVGGALDDRLADLPPGRHELRIPDADALAVGLACGGVADVFVQPAADVPDEAWTRLAGGRPVTIVTDLDGTTPGSTIVRNDDRIATTETRVVEEGGVTRLVAAYRPTPRLMVVGDGLIASALERVAGVLGWVVTVSSEGIDGGIEALGPADGVVVLSHDLDVAVPALRAALGGLVGYIGALGSRGTQERRAEALGGLDRSRLHGPAGLDLGSATPEEIALSIVAEALATVRGGTGEPLSRRGGTIHR